MTPKTRQYVYCDSGTFWQGGVIEPTQQPMKPHYYVMRVGYDGSPTVKHKTLEDAQREA